MSPTDLAARLGLVRVVVGAFVAVNLLLVRGSMIHAGYDDPSLFKPVGVAVLLDAPLTAAAWTVTYDATVVFAIAFALGFAWRVVAPVLAALLLLVGSYRLSWGTGYHDLHLLAIHVLVLAFTAPPTLPSVDSWMARRFPRWQWLSVPSISAWRFGWTLRLLSITTVTTYFLAGVAKVVGPAGWGWASGENLLDQIGTVALVRDLYGETPARTVPEFLYASPSALAPLAVLTLALELGAPLALVHRRVGMAWAAGIVAMHLGIAALMGIVFPYLSYGVAFLSFFPVERLLRRGER